MDPKNTTMDELRAVINEWNSNRLDLFEISMPNQDLEFTGVMRFYFQDAGQKVATKCIRVASTASTDDVIAILIEKFRPDIRMLSFAEYALYEIHESGEERKLDKDEKPLVVQLNWNKDDREGRFLLRRMDEKTILGGFDNRSKLNSQIKDESNNNHNNSSGGGGGGGGFRRKLSKRERKEKKKKDKEDKAKDAEKSENDEKLAERLYNELPETSFTRSISNPEAVMRRRRQQKLEKKLQQLVSEGGSEAGGTLRIFGEQLNKDVPYKTLLLSKRENAAFVVKEILDKYGLEKENPDDYCLVQMIVPPNLMDFTQEISLNAMHSLSENIKEYILDDDDCPLMIEKAHNKALGILTFHIRRKPENYQPKKRKKNGPEVDDSLPYLIEVNADGSDLTIQDRRARRHLLIMNVTEVGCSSGLSSNFNSQNNSERQFLHLVGGNVQPKHCVIANIDGIVTVTPQIHSDSESETFVNGLKIADTTILKHGMLVRFGKQHTFRFVDPNFERTMSSAMSPDFLSQMAKISQSNNQVEHSDRSETGGGLRSENRDSRASRDPMIEDAADTVSNYSKTSRKSENELRTEAILPAILELWEETVDLFLNAIFNNLNVSEVSFKLAPTYTVYMAIRYCASTHFLPHFTPEERAVRLTQFTDRLSEQLLSLIRHQTRDAPTLAFWLANSSEMLYFLKQDRHLNAFTLTAQRTLADCVQLAFRHLVSCLESQLDACVSGLLSQNEQEASAAVNAITGVLSQAMTLLRDFRVNAALTIQLFSQLFHFINMRLFNQLIGVVDTSVQPPPPMVNFCTYQWALLLRPRLDQLSRWAERQGLELAAECYLGRTVQATNLFEALETLPAEALPEFVSSKCFKLNSMQLRALLKRFEPSGQHQSSPILNNQLIEQLVLMAKQTVDELCRTYGRPIRLPEDADLELPFLLPEDGYSAGKVKGFPAALHDFISPLVQRKLCNLTMQPSSAGFWTIYLKSPENLPPFNTQNPISNLPNSAASSHMPPSSNNVTTPQHTMNQNMAPPTPTHQQQGYPLSNFPNSYGSQPVSGQGYVYSVGAPMEPPQSPLNQYSNNQNSNRPQPEVCLIKLRKGNTPGNTGMGLSIVAARASAHEPLGIYIKNVVRGGAADRDGRLRAGDQLLKVDGHSLIGIAQEKAAELMHQTGLEVTLEVAKQAASYNGLTAVLQNQSQRSVQSNTMMPKSQTMEQMKAHSASIAALNAYSTYPYGGQYSMNPPNVHQLPPMSQMNHHLGQPMSPTIGYGSNMGTGSRPGSQVGMQPARQPLYEERTYQNIGLYQTQPTSQSGVPPPPPLQRMQPIYSGESQTLPAPGGRPLSTILTGRDQEQFTGMGMMTGRQPQYSSMAQLPIQQRQSIASQQMGGVPSQTLPNAQSMYMMRTQSQLPLNANAAQWNAQRQQIYGTYQPMSNQTLPGRLGPQPGPKPLRNQMQINQSMQQLNQGNMLGTLGQPMDSVGMQSTPPPPLPPPQVSYRYGVSGYPPKPSQQSQQPIYGTNGGGPNQTSNSISPWDREEKEKQQQLKLEEVRRQREKEIIKLESLGNNRDSFQEERLRKLRLEMEFQHRAEYAAGEDDEDTEAVEAEILERAEQREQQLLRQEELERTRQRRAEWQQQQQIEEQEQRLRRLKMEENKLKEELQVTQQVEERLIREAKKRREEPNRANDLIVNDVEQNQLVADEGMSLQQQQKLQKFLSKAANGNSPMFANVNNNSSQGNQSNKSALRNGPESNQQKKVSWNNSVNIVEQEPQIQYADESEEEHDNQQTETLGNNYEQSSNQSSEPRSNENRSLESKPRPEVAAQTIQEVEEEEDEEGEVEDSFTLQDIDEVLGAPVDVDFGPNGTNATCTPNVIGAQEVYRDPRERIKAEKQKQSNNNTVNVDVPEKLSFHEKMRMFGK